MNYTLVQLNSAIAFILLSPSLIINCLAFALLAAVLVAVYYLETFYIDPVGLNASIKDATDVILISNLIAPLYITNLE